MKEQVGFQTAAKPPGCACCREHDVSPLWWDERKTAGILSSFSVPPGINQAIPPQLMSPKRLFGSSLFSVLLIGCYREGGLYLIGSGTTMPSEGLRPFLSHKVKVNIQQPFCDSPLRLSKCPCLAESFCVFKCNLIKKCISWQLDQLKFCYFRQIKRKQSYVVLILKPLKIEKQKQKKRGFIWKHHINMELTSGFH